MRECNLLLNKPLPSSKNSQFQNEARCKTILVRFVCMRMKNPFHINGFARSLALKQRLGVTGNDLFWKLEDLCFFSFLSFFLSFFFFFTLTPIPGVKGDYPYSQLRHNCTGHYLQEWLYASWKNTADRAVSLTSSLSLTAIDPRYLIYTFVLLHTPWFAFIILLIILLRSPSSSSFTPISFDSPCALFIQQKFPFETSEILRAKWNGTFRLHRPDPNHRTFSLLFLQAGYKGAVLRTTICQMERGISVQPTEMTGPFKVDRPPSKMSQIFWSNRSEMVRSIWFPTEISGILGWIESAAYLPPLASLHPLSPFMYLLFCLR